MVKGYDSVIIEMDNLDAYQVIRDFNMPGAPAQVFDSVSQITILLKDRRWVCVLAYVFLARNHVARFLVRLGKDVCDRLYILNHMIDPMAELINWDMRLGVDHPDYMDVVISDDAPNPVNFKVAVGIANQINAHGGGAEMTKVAVEAELKEMEVEVVVGVEAELKEMEVEVVVGLKVEIEVGLS
ncbi:hypothetical protein DCAR_0727741 [Daucus carota subsp. sativus]|uniref:RNase H type-1 domain-containing protein n=1 Tax=Daucus carota subsp. sativus TaxID=79200 RepID=A0AAF1B880_DAUCS|nr:hypothetical protein DCAR_0727741 [Daucus carota subsp. sativus]